MMRGLLVSIGALSCFVATLPITIQSASAQSNEYHWVNVCNRGDVDLNYVVLRTRWNLGQGDRAQLSGWHTIRKGQCDDVNTSVYQGIAIGFTHTLWEGGVGNPVYVPEEAEPANGNKRAPSILCVPQSGSINRKGSLSSVLSATSPPCASGTYPLRMSFYSKPGEYAPVPKFIIKPRYSAPLARWPEELQTIVPAARTPQKQQTLETVQPDISKKLREGHAKMRRTFYTDLCKDSLLATYFQMNQAKADTGCTCLAAKLVAEESDATLQALERNINTRRFQLLGDSKPPGPEDFSVVLDQTFGREKMSRYIVQCLVEEK